MSNHDPISDMLTRIRNASEKRHDKTRVPASRMARSIAKVLQNEGFISHISEEGEGVKTQLIIELKYSGKHRHPTIRSMQRVSKPGLRIYKNVKNYSKPFSSKNTRIKKLNILVNQRNDLEKVAFKHYPNLKKIKKTMENLSNVFFVRMSGSGSSIVAYFSSKKASLIALKILKKKI